MTSRYDSHFTTGACWRRYEDSNLDPRLRRAVPAFHFGDSDIMVAAPRLALGASSFAERCSICLSYAAVAAREGFEPTPGAINSRVPYQLGDLAAVRKGNVYYLSPLRGLCIAGVGFSPSPGVEPARFPLARLPTGGRRPSACPSVCGARPICWAARLSQCVHTLGCKGARGWQAGQDSNPQQLFWRQLCCRYTTDLHWYGRLDLNQRSLPSEGRMLSRLHHAHVSVECRVCALLFTAPSLLFVLALVVAAPFISSSTSMGRV